MKQIPLSQGKVALVDDEDFERVNQYKWTAHYGKHSWYAIRAFTENGVRHYVHMHRFIMQTPDDLEVDHINHDGLDNRKGNLRNVTRKVNCQNRKRKADHYIGVQVTPSGKCRAVLCGEYLGVYNTVPEAAAAYDIEAVKRGFLALNQVRIKRTPSKFVYSNPYPGVSLHKPSGLWRAYAKDLNAKSGRIYLGYRKTPEEAHQLVIEYLSGQRA